MKINKPLFNEYIIQLNINEEDDKTLSMLRQEIIDKLSTIYLSNNILVEEDDEQDIEFNLDVPLILNHELTQFTKGKTEQTLNKVCERYLLNSILNDSHIIQIIVTNKSLGETKQWKIRTKNKMNEYENIDVDILSSDIKSEYHTIEKFISKIMMAKTKNELLDTLHKQINKQPVKLSQHFGIVTELNCI